MTYDASAMNAQRTLVCGDGSDFLDFFSTPGGEMVSIIDDTFCAVDESEDQRRLLTWRLFHSRSAGSRPAKRC